MPEPYWPKKKGSYRLSDAAKNNQYAKLRCRYCKAERYFLVTELRTAFGDIEWDDVVHQNNWRCTGCGQTNIIKLDLAACIARLGRIV